MFSAVLRVRYYVTEWWFCSEARKNVSLGEKHRQRKKRRRQSSHTSDGLSQLSDSNSPRFEPITGCTCMDLITGM